MFRDLALTAASIAATTRRTEKERFLADYLRTLDDPSLQRAAVFFTGAAFPRKEERVTGVGWATVGEAASEAAGVPLGTLWHRAQERGDLGEAAAELFPGDRAAVLTVLEVGELFDSLAATAGALAKKELLTSMFRKATAEEAGVLAKILLGEFRIGIQEGLVESAIAKAFGRPLKSVRRANMLSADIGTTALLARSNALESACLTLFHPIGLMLAQPEEDPEKIIAQLGSGALADDKYDGIRAQIHAGDGVVRIYSRTLDEISARFPEIGGAAAELAHQVILDGEIVAFRDRILPFAVLQTRLGRRKLSAKLLEGAPVRFFAFDLLFEEGESLLDHPLEERLRRLRSVVPAEGTIQLSFQRPVREAKDVDQAFDDARARINEGLVVKDPGSLYTPGRRGKAWLKYKKALATLDCVVTAAEYGHGKRRGVLSDYTFAVRRDDELVNIGKAYSGVTDAEIAHLTRVFKESTISRYGPVHVVEPRVVLEIAFDRIQESKRHKSGYALRFPRIAHVREDKSVEEISTIDEVRRIFEAQERREKGDHL